MKTGTKSLLFGVHQFLWHPITVWLAWVKLYGEIPNWKETICIIIHDWGYWGKVNMDDEEGEKHPEFAANFADKYFGYGYGSLCLYHSRHYARNSHRVPSKLCWADKYCIIYDPWWLYLPRAWLSGELHEYREIAHGSGFMHRDINHRKWFAKLRTAFIKIALEKKGDAVQYVNKERM